MIRTAPVALSLFLASAAALPAHAQKLAPGLWETQMTMKSAGGEMEAAMARAKEQMAKMPPEQRKMMEDMMAKQGVGLGAGGSSFRYCMGKEQAERGDWAQDADNRCKREGLERSGATTRFRFTCTNPPSSGSGEITMASDKAYSMKMNVTSTDPKGKAQQMEMLHNAKWVGADCGTLKPRQP